MIESADEGRWWTAMDASRIACQIALDEVNLDDVDYLAQTAAAAIKVMVEQAAASERKLRPVTISIEYDAAYLTHVLRAREA